MEITDSPLTSTTDQLPTATDLVEISYSGDSEQLPDRSDLVTEESS
nr:hypothetical protein [Nostoc punctiforme]